MTTATKKRRGDTITLHADEFRAAVRTVAPAVSNRHATLCQVLLGDTVEATDGELRITVAYGASARPVLVPHQRLAAILGTVGGEVTVETCDTSVKIRASRGEWTLPSSDAAEWPQVAEGKVRPFARLPADQFARAVRAVIDATDDDSSRYALGGVLLEHKGPHVAFVATDGRRLNCHIVDIDQATDDSSVIVPRRAMQSILRTAEQAGDEGITLGVCGADLVVECGDAVIRARLLEGRFPRWLDVIPADVRPRFGSDDDTYAEPPAHAEISAGELLAAVRQARIVTSEQSKGVKFVFTPSGLMLEARSAEGGESIVTADLPVAGIKVAVSLDPAFVAGWLAHVDAGAMVEVYAKDHQSAVTLRHEDSYAVVMPMAVD